MITVEPDAPSSSAGDPSLGQMPQSGPPLFISTRELDDCLDALTCAIRSADGVSIVLGDTGAGKTTLSHRLQEHALGDWSFCRIDASPLMQPEQFLMRLARCLSVADDEQMFARIIEEAGSCLQCGRPVVLIVDDAEFLPEATIAMLLRLIEERMNGKSLIRIVLFAHPSVEVLLDSPSVRAMNSTLVERTEIPRFSDEQAESYLEQLLALHHTGPVSAISGERRREIILQAGGIPGKIHEAAIRLIGCEPASRGPASLLRRLRSVPGFALTFGMVALAIFLWVGPRPGTQGPPAQVDAAGDLSVRPLEIPKEPRPVLSDEARAERERAPELRRSEDRGQDDPDGDAAPVVVSATSDAVARPVVGHAPPPHPEGGSLTSAAPLAPRDVGITAATDVPTVAVAEAGKTEPKQAELPAATQNAQQTKGEGRDWTWLLAQPGESYTLQLLGVGDPAGIPAFIDRNRLHDGAHLIATRRDRKPWYVLLYGSYADRNSAGRAKTDISGRIGGAGIWVRSFDSVRAAFPRP